MESYHNMIELTWKPPEKKNGLLSSYFIQVLTPGNESRMWNTTMTNFTIKNLTPFTTYTIKVRNFTSALDPTSRPLRVRQYVTQSYKYDNSTQ